MHHEFIPGTSRIICSYKRGICNLLDLKKFHLSSKYKKQNKNIDDSLEQ
jgi:hypothetical protein